MVTVIEWLIVIVRYVGDMLAWLHQICPGEAENITQLLKLCNKVTPPPHSCWSCEHFIYRRPTLYPLEIAVDFFKSP